MITILIIMYIVLITFSLMSFTPPGYDGAKFCKHPYEGGKSDRANEIDGYVRARNWTYPLTAEQLEILEKRFPN